MPLLTRDDLARQSRPAWLCLLLLAAVAGLLWTIGRQAAALGTLAALLGCVGLILPPRERMAVLPFRLRRLPRSLDVAPVIGTLLTSPGYGVGAFYVPGPYDEIVHLVSGGLAGAVLGAMLTVDGRPRTVRHVTLFGTALGLAIAIAWEAFEWATGLIGSRADTLSDVLLTALGALLGAWAWARLEAPRRAG